MAVRLAPQFHQSRDQATASHNPAHNANATSTRVVAGIAISDGGIVDIPVVKGE
ncbi:hypothetical protein WCLP8_2630003 [uncultured Gammaproteobacteria bacterium]